jgi:hypothetical protein
MTRKTVRWVIGTTAGLIATTGLATGTAQATSTNLPGSLTTPGGLVGAVPGLQMLPVGAVTGILPVGK